MNWPDNFPELQARPHVINILTRLQRQNQLPGKTCYLLMEKNSNQWHLIDRVIPRNLRMRFTVFWERARSYYYEYCQKIAATHIPYILLDSSLPEGMPLRRRGDLNDFRKQRALWLNLELAGESKFLIVLIQSHKFQFQIATLIREVQDIQQELQMNQEPNTVNNQGTIAIKWPAHLSPGKSPAFHSETVERIAHDLNKPLSNLFMTHAIMDQDLRQNNDIKESDKELISEQMRRMALQMQEIHNFSQSLLHLQTGRAPGIDRTDTIKLIKFLENQIDIFADQLANLEIKLIRNFCLDFEVKINTTATGRILSNLISNAAHFCARPGAIYIEVERHQDLWHLDIEDNGQGLHATDAMLDLALQNIGRQGGGWGLGLAASVELAASLQGSLRSLPPRYGSGARFLLVLPVRTD